MGYKAVCKYLVKALMGIDSGGREILHQILFLFNIHPCHKKASYYNTNCKEEQREHIFYPVI